MFITVVRHFFNLINALLPASRCFAFRRIMLRVAGVTVASTCRLCGRGWIYGRGEIHLGAETWISPGFVIYSNPNASVVVGERCDIGPDVTVLTGSHDIGDHSRRAGVARALNVVIENGCWIGARALLLPGVRVGSGSIVAAGSVVSRDVDADSLTAGVPAVLKRVLEDVQL